MCWGSIIIARTPPFSRSYRDRCYLAKKLLSNTSLTKRHPFLKGPESLHNEGYPPSCLRLLVMSMKTVSFEEQIMCKDKSKPVIFMPNGTWLLYWLSSTCFYTKKDKMLANSLSFKAWHFHFSAFAGVALWTDKYVPNCSITATKRSSHILQER